MRRQGMQYHLVAAGATAAAFTVMGYAGMDGRVPFYIDGTMNIPVTVWQFAAVAFCLVATGYCIAAKKHAQLLTLEEREATQKHLILEVGAWMLCGVGGVISWFLLPVAFMAYNAPGAIATGAIVQICIVAAALRLIVRLTMRRTAQQETAKA